MGGGVRRRSPVDEAGPVVGYERGRHETSALRYKECARGRWTPDWDHKNEKNKKKSPACETIYTFLHVRTYILLYVNTYLEKRPLNIDWEKAKTEKCKKIQ